ncbi:disease resistance protein SUMM2-like [Vitis riparia]|uniref:disease resistance protein SUMM2-like n=1 Tax=Vitis riparia TaxID=96939 RepID=UPI00155A706F|nr:disease resistance protein SUMM2-like [Vitis riparia]
MALWITSEMGEMKGKFLVQTSAGLTQAPDFVKWTTTERISLMNKRIEKLTGSPTCPNLLTLRLDLNSDLQMISNGFFQFMPNLRVLSLSRTKIVELPSDISNLVSLQYLDLCGTEIKKLPIEMKNLVQLKILMLCLSKVSSIPRGLISSLLMLQAVGMYNCGLYGQAVEGSVESYGMESLVEELESLKYLTLLTVTIASASVFKRFLSSRKLPSCTYAICLKMFKGSSSLNLSSLENMKHLYGLMMEDLDSLREIKFDWAGKGKETVGYSSLNPKVKCFHGLCKVVINRCQMLKNLTWLIFAPNLLYLKIGQCDEIEELIGKGAEDGGNLSPFTKLIRLELNGLPQLKNVYRNPLPFLYLGRIEVIGCPKLKRLPLNSNSANQGRVVMEMMPPRKTTSSQNSQANDGVLLSLEGLPPMNAEGLYKYLRTFVGLVECQARAAETNGQGQSSSSRSSSFDDFKKLGPYFSNTSNPTEVEAWILKMEKFFDVIDYSEEQKASYAAFMLEKEADPWWHMTKRLLED